MKLKVGQRVRHIYHREEGTIIRFITGWDDGLGNRGTYIPELVVVKLDDKWATGGNDGFMTYPADRLEVMQ